MLIKIIYVYQINFILKNKTHSWWDNSSSNYYYISFNFGSILDNYCTNNARIIF